MEIFSVYTDRRKKQKRVPPGFRLELCPAAGRGTDIEKDAALKCEEGIVMKRLLAIFLCAALLTGCTQPGISTVNEDEEISLVLAEPQPSGETLREDGQIQTDFSQHTISIPEEEYFAAVTNDWSLRLLGELREDGENLLISPLSIGQALGLAANGMKGETLNQTLGFLGGGISLSALNQEYTAQRSRLEGYRDAAVRIANSIWYDESLTVREDFLNLASSQYSAEIAGTDFSSPEAISRINAWTEEKTEGKITDLFPELSEDTALCLVNAVYFNALWESEVPGYAVLTGRDFYPADGSTQKTDYMSSVETYLHAEGASGILKPYQEKDLAFLAVLPDGDLSSYLDSLTGEKLLSLLDSAGTETADTHLPIFEMQMEKSLLLNNAMQNLGVGDMFDPTAADLSGISGDAGDLWVDQMVHKTFIRVDRKGTEAAAATGMAMEAGAAAPVERKAVILNRPFLFAVMDMKTKTPLFLGVYESAA